MEENDMIGPAPICMNCALLSRNKNAAPLSCKAFPDGISDAIIMGKVVHDHLVAGDNGFTFTPNTGQIFLIFRHGQSLPCGAGNTKAEAEITAERLSFIFDEKCIIKP